MVGGDHHDGVAVQALRAQPVQDLADQAVDVMERVAITVAVTGGVGAVVQADVVHAFPERAERRGAAGRQAVAMHRIVEKKAEERLSAMARSQEGQEPVGDAAITFGRRTSFRTRRQPWHRREHGAIEWRMAERRGGLDRERIALLGERAHQHRRRAAAAEHRPVGGGQSVEQAEDAGFGGVAAADVVMVALRVAGEGGDARGDAGIHLVMPPTVDDDQQDVVAGRRGCDADRTQRIAQVGARPRQDVSARDRVGNTDAQRLQPALGGDRLIEREDMAVAGNERTMVRILHRVQGLGNQQAQDNQRITAPARRKSAQRRPRAGRRPAHHAFHDEQPGHEQAAGQPADPGQGNGVAATEEQIDHESVEVETVLAEDQGIDKQEHRHEGAQEQA